MNKSLNITPVHAIGVVARLLGVSVETIRLYERKGLVLAEKTSGNQRLYSDEDIERLRCIRMAINDHKISIEGIRRLHSMIPCWTHVQCSQSDRDACPAHMRSEAGCWTYAHQGNACHGRTCRTCPVYKQSADCGKIKSLILGMQAEPPPSPGK